MAHAGVKVWDPLVRISHWLLVITVTASWLVRHSPGRWHEWLGYAALGVAVARIAWGCVGTPNARFRDFVRAPGDTASYARAVLAGREPRHVGHNPLGGWMIVALLLDVVLVGFTGWLYTTDRFWGVEWVDVLHGSLADALIVLVALHIAGVVYSSVRHRENLVGAMFHGRKRP